MGVGKTSKNEGGGAKSTKGGGSKKITFVEKDRTGSKKSIAKRKAQARAKRKRTGR